MIKKKQKSIQVEKKGTRPQDWKCKKTDLFYQSICHPVRVLKIPQVAILGDLHYLKGSSFFFQILVQPHCLWKLPAKSRDLTHPPSQLRKILKLWPGQNPGKGQVQLGQGYKKPLSIILCSPVWSAGVSTCLHPFDQKKLPWQDLLSLLCLFLAPEGL
jgi:hypothetical protein